MADERRVRRLDDPYFDKSHGAVGPSEDDEFQDALARAQEAVRKAWKLGDTDGFADLEYALREIVVRVEVVGRAHIRQMEKLNETMTKLVALAERRAG